MCYKQCDIFKCLLELFKLGAGTFRCFSLAHPREGYLGAYSGTWPLRLKIRSEPPTGLGHGWASSDYSVMSQHKSPALSSDNCCQRKQRLGCGRRIGNQGKDRCNLVCTSPSTLWLICWAFSVPWHEASSLRSCPCLMPQD